MHRTNTRPPAIDFLEIQVRLGQDSDGDAVRGFSLQFRKAQLAAQSMGVSIDSMEKKRLLGALNVALPTAATVFENVWEKLHSRPLLLDSAASLPWADTDPDSHQKLFHWLQCACLIADQHHWQTEASAIAEAVYLTLDSPSGFDTARAIAKASGGDPSAAHQLLTDGQQDDAMQLALASALLMAGDAGWERVVDRLLACSSDVHVRQTGHELRQASDQWL